MNNNINVSKLIEACEYIREQCRAKDADAIIKKMPDNFRETIMQRFMKRT